MRACGLLVLAACTGPRLPSFGASDVGTAPDAATGSNAADEVAVTAVVNSTRFVVREHMLAAGEMQISGEPFAEAMGRDLGGYSRDLLPTDLYTDPSLGFAWIDLAGFSTAVESYEYSKQPMNFLGFESGAGTSLSHSARGANLAVSVQHFAAGSSALGKWVFPAGTYPLHNPVGNTNPTGTGKPENNPLGWPGIWPTVHLFQSFDPKIAPTAAVAQLCSISSDDSPAGLGTRELCGDYECDASALHLVDRSAQVDATIAPGSDGFATWKYGLWVLNYLQVMHDDQETAIDTVPEAELGLVGTPSYAIRLGSSDIEGFQAAMFILEVDARADDWLARLTTSDGITLSGFATTADALAYDYARPLRWFPGQIAVTETAGSDGFPVPAYAIGSADSELLDLAGLALGYSEFFALTDRGNTDVGGSQPARVYFDGDPFASDDQLPDGEDTLHDRALAMIRVAVIDMDRMHSAGGVLVDHATAAGPGDVASTITTAYTLLALRTVNRALGSQLELYSNNTPDSATAGALDAIALNYPSNPSLAFSARVRALIHAEGDLLYDHLTDDTGRAYAGWNTSTQALIDPSDTLDSHTAAIRGLFAAFLATGDTKYRTRARAVYARMEATFYDADARVYRQDPAADVMAYTVIYTPLRFALLQSTLRDMYELVANQPGGEALVPILEERVGRLDKLVLNGWDDRDRNQHVDTVECVRYDPNSSNGHGGLQMAERALTGEIGRQTDEGALGPESADRNANCVPEVDNAGLPAALADAITFTVTRTRRN